jgi:monomeric sarcosine oxidase
MPDYDLAIIGAGVMGAAAACEAARDGARVAVIEQSSLPNPRAASIDHSKVFRFAYPDPLYAQMAVDALSRWRALEEETGARLMTRTGVLVIEKQQHATESETYRALRSLDLEVELLDSRAVSARFPQFNRDAFPYAIYDPSGAILHAETAVRALIELARRQNVTLIENERVIDVRQAAGARVSVITERGSEFNCARACVASGPWARNLMSFLNDKLTTTRQEIVYFEPATSQQSFEAARFPIFIEVESGFYGFPIHHNGAMKIANHHKGEPVEPYSSETEVGDDFINRCRAFFSEFIPALSGAQARETRVCIYNNTPDDDFIIDWHTEIENLLIVTGFSGHGFKFGPTIGRISSDLLISNRTSFNIERFSLSRFRTGEVIE